MRLKYLILSLIVGFAVLGFQQSPGIAGKWYGNLKGPKGQVAKLVYDFKVDGRI
jgi:hypothetical protein